MAERLTYDHYRQIADELYDQQVEMPSAAKTHKLIGYGSLATHQLYLNRWREQRRQKPVSLKERHKNAVIEKAIEFADKLMKEHGHEIRSFKADADAKVKAITEQLQAAQQGRQLALRELEQSHRQLTHLESTHHDLTEKYTQGEKDHIVAQETHKALLQQLEAMKENHQQQMTLLHQQHTKSECYLQSQINAQRDEIAKLQQQRQLLENNHAIEKKKLEEQLSALFQEKQDLEKVNILLNQQVLQLESAHHTLSQEKTQLQQKIDEINQENKNLIDWQHEQIIKETSTTAEMNQLREQLKEAKSIIVEQQQEIRKSAVEIGKLQQQFLASAST